ncbi:MAG: glycosyltransferase, partial [Coleofasciculus sp. C3-bin4]|nr:glycosyltransferase [Coleofasciculus sp. C3-bin4]
MNIGKSQPEPEGETSSLSAGTLPLVSVIIPCFNRAHYLGEAVESVVEQTYTNLECIIVDDGSTDNTRQLCEALMSKD